MAAADNINDILKALVQAEIERLREKTAVYTGQVLRGLFKYFVSTRQNTPGAFEDAGRTADFIDSNVVFGSDSASRADKNSFKAEPKSAAGFNVNHNGIRAGIVSAVKEIPEAGGKDDSLRLGGDFSRSVYTAVETGMKALAQRVTGQLEKHAGLLIGADEKTSENLLGYYSGMIGGSAVYDRRTAPEVNIYMTGAQPDSKTAEILRRRLEEFTEDAFGGDGFFSRMRPR